MKTAKDNFINTLLLFFALIFVLGVFSVTGLLRMASLPTPQSITEKVFANYEEDKEDEDEDEDEDEHEDEDEDADDDYKEEEVIYEVIEIPVTPVPAPPVYITVIDSGYDVDTDGDKLVDAIDPHPTINEYELFTDDDNDGVPNANDQYKGENDFFFVDFTDENKNGILDTFEY